MLRFIICIILLYFTFPIIAQNDLEIGVIILQTPENYDGISQGAEYFENYFNSWDGNGINVETKRLNTSSNYSESTLISAINNMKDKDGLIIYIIGRGFKPYDKAGTPYLYLHSEDKENTNERKKYYFDLDNIYGLSKKSGIDDIIVIGDFTSFLDWGASKITPIEQIFSKPIKPVKPERIRELFADSKQQVTIIPYRNSNLVLSQQAGGMIAYSFIQILNEHLYKETPLNWKFVIDTFNSKYNQFTGEFSSEHIFPIPIQSYIASERTVIPPPIEPDRKRLKLVEWLLNGIDERKYKKEWNKALKNEKPCGDGLNFLINNSDSPLNNSEKAKYPVTARVLIAILAEECGIFDGNEINGINKETIFKIIQEGEHLWDNGNHTAKDSKLLEKMEKKIKKKGNKNDKSLNSTFQAILGYGDNGTYKWFKAKKQVEKEIYEEKLGRAKSTLENFKKRHKENEERIDKLKKDTILISGSIRQMQREKGSLLSEVNNLENIKDSLLQEGFVLKIPNVSLTNNELENIKTAYRCLNEGKAIETCTSHLTTREKQVFQASTNCFRGINKYNDELGNPCPANRTEIVNQLIPLSFRQLEQLKNAIGKEEFKTFIVDYLKIDASFIGKADFKGRGQKIGQKNFSKIDIGRDKYYNRFNSREKFSHTSGGPKDIYNEELAYLRAYCMYQIVKETLFNTYGIRLSDAKHDVIFYGLEQENDSESERDDWRGAEFKICFGGISDYIVEKILKIEKRIKEIDSQIDEANNTINGIVADIKRLQTENGIIRQAIADQENIVKDVGKILGK